MLQHFDYMFQYKSKIEYLHASWYGCEYPQIKEDSVHFSLTFLV